MDSTISKAERCQCLSWLVLEVGWVPQGRRMLRIYRRAWFFKPRASFGMDLYTDIYQYIDICSWYRSRYIYMAIFKILCHSIIQVRNNFSVITYKNKNFLNELPFISVIFGNFLMQQFGGIWVPAQCICAILGASVNPSAFCSAVISGVVLGVPPYPSASFLFSTAVLRLLLPPAALH